MRQESDLKVLSDAHRALQIDHKAQSDVLKALSDTHGILQNDHKA
jgi:hypothetical protein